MKPADYITAYITVNKWFRDKYLTSLILILTFFSGFTLYISTLAPTVTFEDSGELIAAAYNLGIPHQPGYPLYTMIGKLFTFIPVSDISYRMNLMSAFFMSLAAAMTSWVTILLVGGVSKQKTVDPVIKAVTGFSAGLLMITSYEIWEQAIIAEVYGLNAFLVASVLTFTLLWARQKEGSVKEKYFLATSFILGLAISHHPTSLILIPVLLIFLILSHRHYLLDLNRLLSGFGLFVLGLLPYLYLPIASARNPKMDWGNPENLTNFIRTVTRHQYSVGGEQTISKYLSQLQAFIDLLTEQWVPVVLLFAVFGLYGLFRRQRNLFYLMILFLIFAGPFTTFVTDFDVSVANKFIAAENKALVSVAYIPCYIGLAILMGCGIYQIILMVNIGDRFRRLLGIIGILIPVTMAAVKYDDLDMSRYFYAEDYVNNLLDNAEVGSLIMANWDPFYFPFNYYQYVKNQKVGVIVLDEQLLKRSWYIEMMSRIYPTFMSRSKKEIDEFLNAVRPFEENRPYNGNFIQSRYVNLINSIIDQTIGNGDQVYLTYVPSQGVAEGYQTESIGVALRLTKNTDEVSDIDPGLYRFRGFSGLDSNPDRMARVMGDYYFNLMVLRANELERKGFLVQAKNTMKTTLNLVETDSEKALKIRKSIGLLDDFIKDKSQEINKGGKQ